MDSYVAPSQAPVRFIPLAVNSRTLELIWKPPEKRHQNGLIREYVVSIMVVETLQMNRHIVEGTTHRLLLDNLHPSYTYNCSVYAVTVLGGPVANAIVQLPEDGKLGNELKWT